MLLRKIKQKQANKMIYIHGGVNCEIVINIDLVT